MSGEPTSPEPDVRDAKAGRAALATRRARHDYDRLLMLSDGVFAIAITLAALEIRAPEGGHADAGGLLSLMTPGLVTYGVSFVVIAAYWSGHRRMFAMLQRVDGLLILLNLVLLGLVALQPAAVGMLMRLGPQDSAVTLYLGLIVATGVAQSLFWGHAAFVGRLVDPAVGYGYRIGQLITGLMLPVVAAGLTLYSMRSGSLAFIGLAIALVAGMSIARHRLNRSLER